MLLKVGVNFACTHWIVFRFADQFFSIILQKAGNSIAVLFILLSQRLERLAEVLDSTGYRYLLNVQLF